MIVPFQKQVSQFWSKQSGSQRITMIVLLLAAAILIPVLISWATTPSYSVAYSGLSETDAGQIVQNLEEAGIPYRLKSSGTIEVPTNQVYDARLKMAVAGLPSSSTVGYELFDGSTLGMTEFTQKVDYQRALEGELERTIGSLDAVQAVRVHIVTPDKSLLTSDQNPTTASVTVQEKGGKTLDASQVRAITNLVASSVEGLQPENVVVVDSQGNMLAGGSSNSDSASTTQSDSQRAAEAAAASDIRSRVQSMLDTILGPDKAVVQAAVSMNWTQKETTSNTYDPTAQVVRSSDKVSESYGGDASATGGIPGASSNLPTPAPTTTAGANSTSYQRSEETINYEISQVQSKEVVSPGQVDRISVSVMVDNITDQNQLQTIKNAAAAAAGIDETRGDQIVVDSMAFDRSYYESQAADLASSQKTNTYTQIGIGVGAGLLLLFLLIYFSRMIRKLRVSSQGAWKPVMLPVGEMTMNPALAASATNGAIAAGSTAGNLPQGQPGQSQSAGKTGEDGTMEFSSRFTPSVNSAEDSQRSKVINRLAEENPATVAEIIQIWLNEDNKSHG